MADEDSFLKRDPTLEDRHTVQTMRRAYLLYSRGCSAERYLRKSDNLIKTNIMTSKRRLSAEPHRE